MKKGAAQVARFSLDFFGLFFRLFIQPKESFRFFSHSNSIHHFFAVKQRVCVSVKQWDLGAVRYSEAKKNGDQ